MENIFKNTYFGKPYKTRDGRKALFIKNNNDKHFPYDILIQGNEGCIMYDETGKYVGKEPHAYDIISEWEDNTSDTINTNSDSIPDNIEEHKKLSIDDFPGLKLIKEELLKQGWKKVENSNNIN